jgi:nucleotide-binding universal stress UspA family protein
MTAEGTDRVTLLHVVPGFSSGVPPHFYRYGLTEYQSALVRDARQRLQIAVPAERQTAARVETRVLVGDTVAEISRVADSLGADLLVVGAPKRGAVGRALFGSTAGRLLRASRVPVLAIPGAGERSAQPESASLQLAA